jgi:hypothetical protein
MFLGHFAVALAAKRAAPRVSLGTLFLSAQLADLVWPVLVLAGVEEVRIAPGVTEVTPLDFVSYPWSHSLAWLAAWGAALALLRAAVRRRVAGPGEAAWIALVAVSHWGLDVASHRPDVPLLPSGPRLGLGLWHSRPATLLVEGTLFALGVLAYARATRPLGRSGTWGLAALVAALVAVYAGAVFGPPPPSATALAASALGVWVFVAAGYAVDARRSRRP